jgi:hypothetical protein
MRRDPRLLHHLGTVSFAGQFWDAYLELDDSAGHAGPVRGRIAFSAAGGTETEAVRTASIFVENTAESVLERARDFKTHQLVALLRSCAPDEEGA